MQLLHFHCDMTMDFRSWHGKIVYPYVQPYSRRFNFQELSD